MRETIHSILVLLQNVLERMLDAHVRIRKYANRRVLPGDNDSSNPYWTCLPAFGCSLLEPYSEQLGRRYTVVAPEENTRRFCGAKYHR